MKRIIILLAVVVLSSFTNHKPAYRIYDKTGKLVNYKILFENAKEADIIFFGELHNNPIAHWMQYELTKDLHQKTRKKVMLGAEMFETDDQLILKEYLHGIIREKDFQKEAKLWPNYETDYKPLVDFAKQNKLQFVATNIPRRYAALVNKQGFEGLGKLSEKALQYIAKLPIKYDPELGCYKKMLQMMGGMGGHGVSQNLPKAQAIKDATMAYFIAKNYISGQRFIHFNGNYHTENYEGIIWYLKQYRKDIEILTISTVEQDSIEIFEEQYKNTADYIIATPKTFTKTH